jgi:Mlc titration factor MtfA (ptsG expression regulator)
MLILIGIVVLLGGWLIWRNRQQKKQDLVPLPTNYPQLLQDYVPYYRSLSNDKKKLFEDRVNHFLHHIRIEGVGTTVDDIDKVLVASSAIIPIFGFSDWYYPLTDVLLYEDRFNEAYETSGDGRNILGMVGEGGALKSAMVLSKPALHEGFVNETSKGNTGIHEFVHLLDKVDGATDGLP